MTAIEELWHCRLTNWALWEVGGNSVGVSAYDGEWDDNAPMLPPPLVGEAMDTDTLLTRLNQADPVKYIAIRIKFVWSGSIEERCRQAGMHRDTLNDRVRSAIFRLDDMDQERRLKMSKARSLIAA
jgi:hypothetical protein